MTISIPHIFGVVAIIGARVSGVMMFAPLFGSASVPPRVKAMLVIALTIFIYPLASPHIAAPPVGALIMQVGLHFIIGVAAGVASNIVFDAVQMAGQVLSVQMGYSLVTIMDPQTQADSTVVATFHQTIAMLIFLQANVHFWILRAVTKSFEYLPADGPVIHAGFLPSLLEMGGAIFMVGVQIAAPVLCATLVADIVLGLIGKASPQLPIMQLGPAVKSLLGIGTLMFTLRFWPEQMTNLFMRTIGMADRLFHLAS